MKDKQYLLMILDGVGLNNETQGNAFKMANTPNLDKYMNVYPTTNLKCSGLDVGLPEGQMGNSEVGHTNIGAGRVVYQELTRITKEIKEGNLYNNTNLKLAMDNVKKNNSALHLMGLVSDGGVHSHIEHLYALVEMAKLNNIEKVYIHGFTDGRDTAPTSAINYLKDLEEKIKEIGVGKIVSICGRYYAMDRDKRYERLELAYDMLTIGEGNKFKTVQRAIENAYEAEEFDEFIKPIKIVDDTDETVVINDNDSVIFFNFRPDRARELTESITKSSFDGFKRDRVVNNIFFVTMTCYDKSLDNVHIAYTNDPLKNTFGEYIAKLGYTQLRIAETEKYAHVTFFFNGGQETEYINENRILIPSPKVATYDQQPEMSAVEITDNVIKSIEEKKYDVIIMNYANGDMVGHTGILEKTIEALEVLDKCVGRVISKIEEVNGIAVITADHGNAESMIDFNTGEPVTSHTTNDVPFIVVGKDIKLEQGKLCDISPTILDLMNVQKPDEMEGKSLVIK